MTRLIICETRKDSECFFSKDGSPKPELRSKSKLDKAMMSPPHNLPSTYVRLLSVPFFRDALSLPPPSPFLPSSLLFPPPLFWGQIRFHENRLSPERRSGRRAVERERENSTVTRDTGNTFCGSFKSLTSEFTSATCWLVTYVFVRR